MDVDWLASTDERLTTDEFVVDIEALIDVIELLVDDRTPLIEETELAVERATMLTPTRLAATDVTWLETCATTLDWAVENDMIELDTIDTTCDSSISPNCA